MSFTANQLIMATGGKNTRSITGASATELLTIFSGSNKGLVPNGGDAIKFLRGDATWQEITLVSGYSGFSGLGESGFSGLATSGYSGISGTSAFSGLSGMSAYSGGSAYSGQSAYSGRSAYSGLSGATGATGGAGAVVSHRSSQLTIHNSNTLTSSGLSVTLTAGKTYEFRAVLDIGATFDAGHQYGIDTSNTLSVTYFSFDTQSYNAATNSLIFSTVGGDSTDGTGFPNSWGESSSGATSIYTVISGLIIVNAGGALRITTAQQVAQDADYFVNQRSYLIAWPLS